MRHKISVLSGLALSVATALSAGLAFAAEPVEQNNSNAVWFENWTGLSKASMVVSAPNGQITTIYAETGTPVFQLSGEDILDGVYRYELTAATDEEIEIVNAVDNGRGEEARDTAFKPFQTSGWFTVSRGVIITPEEITEDEG